MSHYRFTTSTSCSRRSTFATLMQAKVSSRRAGTRSATCVGVPLARMMASHAALMCRKPSIGSWHAVHRACTRETTHTCVPGRAYTLGGTIATTRGTIATTLTACKDAISCGLGLVSGLGLGLGLGRLQGCHILWVRVSIRVGVGVRVRSPARMPYVVG